MAASSIGSKKNSDSKLISDDCKLVPDVSATDLVATLSHIDEPTEDEESEKFFLKFVYPTQLFDYASSGNITSLENLLTSAPLDVNQQEEESGRTALHMAYHNIGAEEGSKLQNEAVVRILLDHGARDDIEDNTGFTPLELKLNPHDYNPINSFENKASHLARGYFIVAQANKKLAESKCESKIVFASNVKEAEKYIKTNPNQNRIFFIILTPACIRITQRYDTHSIPIYFERKKNIEHFIILDAQTNLVLFPSDSKNKRKFFYHHLQRQVQFRGCFADTVIMGMNLLRIPSILDFCEKNSLVDKDATNKLDDMEEAMFALLQKRRHEEKAVTSSGVIKVMSLEEKFQFNEYQRRKNNFIQAMLIQLMGLKFDSEIFRLLLLPPILIPHIEHTRSMRILRSYPKQSPLFLERHPLHLTQTVLDYILKKTLRPFNDAKETDKEKAIKKNFINPSKDFDFAGRDFAVKDDVMTHFYKTACKGGLILFKNKLEQKHNVATKRAVTKQPDFKSNSLKPINDLVAEFLVGPDYSNMLR